MTAAALVDKTMTALAPAQVDEVASQTVELPVIDVSDESATKKVRHYQARGQTAFKFVRPQGESTQGWYVNLDLTGSDFTGVTCFEEDYYSAMHLENCKLMNCNFRRTQLRDFYFKKCDLNGADFYGADFRHANSTKSTYVGVKGVPVHKNAPLHLKQLAQQFLSQEKVLWMADWRRDVTAILAEYENEAKQKKPTMLGFKRAEQIHDQNLCGTTYCLAGGAEHNMFLKNSLYAERLTSYFHIEIAGLILLGAEAHSMFYKKEDEVFAWLQEVVRR
jgi:hypothetical protein